MTAISISHAIIKLLKNWTLPCAITAGAVAYAVFAAVPALDGAARFFGPLFDAIFPMFMGMILFTTFCRVDFHRLTLRRWHVRLCALQTVLVAVVAATMIALRPHGNPLVVAESILTCIIAPAAAAAPVVTLKLGGDLEASTAFTFVSNVIVALLVPLVFPMVDTGLHLAFWPAFGAILWKVCLVLVVPMAAAYAVRHLLPALHRRILAIDDLPFYMWAVSLAIVTGSTIKYVLHGGASAMLIAQIAFISLGVCLIQFALGRIVGQHCGNATLEAGQGLGQKNTAFAVWIAAAFLNPLCSVGPGCYILWQNAINSLEIRQHRILQQQQSHHHNHD